MTPEQKQYALDLVSSWTTARNQAAGTYVADKLAALLKELFDAPETEPVGYLYTNVQSGEYHVSDYDDDYRGPERALWCIEPVYRRAKGQQA